MDHDNGLDGSVSNDGEITINPPENSAQLDQGQPAAAGHIMAGYHSSVQTPVPIATPVDTSSPQGADQTSVETTPNNIELNSTVPATEAPVVTNQPLTPEAVAPAQAAPQVIQSASTTLPADEKPTINPLETLASSSVATGTIDLHAVQATEAADAVARPKSKIKLLLSILIPIIVIAAAAGGVWFYGNQQFDKVVAAVDKGRDDDWTLTSKSTDLSNAMSVDVNNIVNGLNDEKATYDTLNATYSDLENKANEALRTYDDADKDITSQEKNLDNFKFSFVLSAPKKDLYSKLKDLISKESSLTTQSSANDKKESYAYLAIFRTYVDMKAMSESSVKDTAAEALSTASPLQKYARPGFTFDNEEMYKADLPEAYNAIQNTKKLLADYYNAISAANAGDEATALKLLANMDNRSQEMENALTNAFQEKNKAWANIYQDESGVSDSYIVAMDKAGIKYHRNREVANYIVYNLEYQNYKENKYPKVSDFDTLKQTLNLKYGTKDTIKYSSPSDSEFILEYQQDGSWIKLDNTMPSSNATAVS